MEETAYKKDGLLRISPESRKKAAFYIVLY